jgi:uncharacterized FlaG/YvyC family protein
MKMTKEKIAKLLEAKKAKVLAQLENAKEWAENIQDELQNAIDNIEDTETAEELQEAIGELEEIRDDSEWISENINEAEKVDDYDLQELVEAEWEAKAEEEAKEEEAEAEEEAEDEEEEPRQSPYEEDTLEEVTRIAKGEDYGGYSKRYVDYYYTETIASGDHYDVVDRRTGEVIEQIW